MKLIKDLEIMTDAKLAEVENEYKDTYGIIHFCYTDPLMRYWDEEYIPDVIGSKAEIEKIAATLKSSEFNGYYIENVLTKLTNN